MSRAAVGFLVIGIWLKEQSNVDEPRAEMNIKNILKAFIPPVGKGARNFYYALFGRLMMVAGYQMITGYQLYIIKYYTLSDSGLDANGLKLKAASIVATMSVITMVVSLLAAFTAGPISDRLGMRKIPVLGSALTSALVMITGNYALVFPACIIVVLIAAFLIMRIKGVK